MIDFVSRVPIGGINWGRTLPAQYADKVATVAVFGNVADRADRSLPRRSTYVIPTTRCAMPVRATSWHGHTEGYVPVYTPPRQRLLLSPGCWPNTAIQVPGVGRSC